MAGWGETPASESKQEASESKPEAKKEEGTDKEPRGMDAVRAILAGQNYFKVLRLPPPVSDLLGRASWEVTEDDIGRAYRKLARFCHPDKRTNLSPEDGELAEKAYLTLGKAKKLLCTENEKGPYIREWLKEEELYRDSSQKGLSRGVEAGDVCGSAERCRDEEEKRRTMVGDMLGAEHKEMGDNVQRGMEKKRKLAEIKKLERTKAAALAANNASDSDSDQEARMRGKGPMIVKAKVDDGEDEEEARKKRQRAANQKRMRGGMKKSA
mmetsp:Transcript_3225/g.7329  ORF Transcript_3225/g.7329 Transcript_3225/m.7329 type:complete len:268 (+) Transcript_3225:3-806(+)